MNRYLPVSLRFHSLSSRSRNSYSTFEQTRAPDRNDLRGRVSRGASAPSGVRIHALFRTECQSFLDGASARTWCSWPEIIADLDSLTETEIEHDGKRFIVRSAPRSSASLALRAAGVALPPSVRDAAAS